MSTGPAGRTAGSISQSDHLIAGLPIPPRSTSRRPFTPNAVLAERHDLTPDVARLVVRPDSPVPAFEPGQYFALGLALDDVPVLRPYSTASPRGAAHTLDFLVRRVPTGTLTPVLWNLSVGERLWIGAPKGLFILKPHDRRTHLLVSAGTGIAPFISMLNELIGTGTRVVVAHGVSYASELAYRPWLESVAAAHADVLYVPTVSRPDAPQNAGWTGRSGRVERLLPSVWEELSLDPADTVAYLCGNPEMVERSRETLLARGLAAESIVHENYWASTKDEQPGSG
jgi:ferredoxin/flavodoxin---NADP+ reductase